MLGGVRLHLAFTHERTCFGYINSKYNSNNDKVSIDVSLHKNTYHIIIERLIN